MSTNLINKFLSSNHELYPQYIPCRSCQGGQMQRKYRTYMAWMGQELITVPDFPVWECDVCKRCEYDFHARRYLKSLLSKESKGDKKTRHSSRRISTNT